MNIMALNLRSIAHREQKIGHAEIANVINAAANEIERLCAVIGNVALALGYEEPAPIEHSSTFDEDAAR